MSRLRHKGVYKLPHGQREVFAVKVGGEEYFLYDADYGFRIPPRYKVNPDRRLTNWFDDFPVWKVEDLTDTGETYQA